MQRKRTRAGAVRWAVVPAACLAAVAGAVLVAGTGTARAATFDPGAWSGYVAKGGPYTSVAADFTVPVGVCASGQNGNGTAYWVGIQGTNDGSAVIVQTGFALICANGQPVYEAVHATLQGGELVLPETVDPGDQIDEAVSCSGTTCWQDLRDVTQNWTDNISDQVENGFSGNIAAVAGESDNGGLPSSATVVTNATVDGAPIGQADPEADQQTLSNYNGTEGLDPTPLDSTGTAFDFYWNGANGRIVGWAGKCADITGASPANRTPVQLYTCNGTDAQNWTAGSGNTITALGKCLGVVAGATANGSRVDIYDCNGSAGQRWTASDGELINDNSGKCLDATNYGTANGTPLQIWTCSPRQANQIWTPPAS
jgi:hypothetical protein